MKRVNNEGSFLNQLYGNMLLNIKWSVPGWVLLALSIFKGWPAGLFIAYFGLWILAIIVSMRDVAFGVKFTRENEPEKVNKNPYSNKGTDKNISDK